MRWVSAGISGIMSFSMWVLHDFWVSLIIVHLGLHGKNCQNWQKCHELKWIKVLKSSATNKLKSIHSAGLGEWFRCWWWWCHSPFWKKSCVERWKYPIPRRQTTMMQHDQNTRCAWSNGHNTTHALPAGDCHCYHSTVIVISTPKQ